MFELRRITYSLAAAAVLGLHLPAFAEGEDASAAPPADTSAAPAADASAAPPADSSAVSTTTTDSTTSTTSTDGATTTTDSSTSSTTSTDSSAAAPTDTSTYSTSSTESSSTESTTTESTTSEEDTRYLGVQGTYTFTDDNRKPVDEGGGVHVILGKQHNEKWNYEFTGDANVYETGKNSGSDYYLYQLGFDALYFLDREGLSPFLLGGLGYAHDDISKNDGDGIYANVGVGFLSAPLNDRGVALRGDVRYIRDFNHSDFDDIRVGLGLQVPFNKPGTNTVTQTQVSTADSDGDGVVDGVDKCPGTLRGLKVDQYGCAIAQTLVLKGVSFDFDSVRLGVNAQTILDEVVTGMKGQPTMKVEIAGHTDNYGSEDYNKSLSQRRADAVREYLISKGIGADSLRATGYGESQPVASNDDDFGREQNRRVEFRIESQ